MILGKWIIVSRRRLRYLLFQEACYHSLFMYKDHRAAPEYRDVPLPRNTQPLKLMKCEVDDAV